MTVPVSVLLRASPETEEGQQSGRRAPVAAGSAGFAPVAGLATIPSGPSRATDVRPPGQGPDDGSDGVPSVLRRSVGAPAVLPDRGSERIAADRGAAAIRRVQGVTATVETANLFDTLPPAVKAAIGRLPPAIQRWLAGLPVEVQRALVGLDEDTQLVIVRALADFAAAPAQTPQTAETKGALVPVRRGAPTVTPTMTMEFAAFLQGQSHLPDWLVRPESPDNADRALITGPQAKAARYEAAERQRVEERNTEVAEVGDRKAVSGLSGEAQAGLSQTLALHDFVGQPPADPTSSVTEAKKQMPWEAAKQQRTRDEFGGAVTGVQADKPNRERPVGERFGRVAAFGARPEAHQAASAAASKVAHSDYEGQVTPLREERDKKITELQQAEYKDRKKKRGNQRGKAGSGSKQAATVATPQEVFDAAEEKVDQQRIAEREALTGKLAAVAGSASGQRLSDAELSWVLANSRGSAPLAQALADLAAMPPDGFALAQQIVAEQDAVRLAPVCGRLITLGAPTKFIPEAADILLGREAQPFGIWLTGCVATNTFPQGLDFSRRFLQNLPLVASVCPALGFGTLATDFMDLMIKTKTKPPEVTALLAASADPHFAGLIRAIENRNPPIASVCSLISPANLLRFTLLELIRIIDGCAQRLDDAITLLAHANDHCPTFVTLVLQATNGKLGNLQLIAALRAEALLTDGVAAFTITQQQADGPYSGGPNYQAQNLANGARTGFATLTFPGGNLAYIHLHWNSRGVAVGVVSSMHVQLQANGQNGLELDEWMTFFPRLPHAVVAALNAALPAPTGGPISMKK